MNPELDGNTRLLEVLVEDVVRQRAVVADGQDRTAGQQLELVRAHVATGDSRRLMNERRTFCPDTHILSTHVPTCSRAHVATRSLAR